MYVPIMKWKRGEQGALFNLEESLKKSTIPLIEVPTHQKDIEKFSHEVDKIWGARPYYFYLSQEWYENIEDDDADDMEEAVLRIFSEHYATLDAKFAIPVFDLTNNHAIRTWPSSNSPRMAIRITGNEFGLIDPELNHLLKDPARKNDTDLLLDLRIVDGDNIFAKQSVLKAALADIDNPADYRSIIIASNSFPSNFNGVEQEKLYEFGRNELEIHKTALRLAEKIGFNYVYSDYGPTDLSDTTFVIGMSPNFKIKYTGFDKYYFIKGIPIKRGGLDFAQVQKACKILYMNESVYMGDSFSWADSKIAEIANATEKVPTGNLTTWVAYSFNHHITFIVTQI